MQKSSIRKRFESALAGEFITYPIYAVYSWFVENRPNVDWDVLFEAGLGQINHANLVRHEHPNFELVETLSKQDGRIRRDVRLITSKGELNEWYLDEWRQEYFIKSPEDYKIMANALEGVKVIAENGTFLDSEKTLGDRGITLGQIQGLGMGRTPLMVLQIDWCGLERFSIDLASELPELLVLIKLMNEIKLEEIREAVKTPAPMIKLWENLSIETLGPIYYRQYQVPLYRQILEIIGNAGKNLLVHYDGQLKAIAEDIAMLSIDGIDSFTEAPEGNMTTAEARKIWPDKFIWQNLNLNWYELPLEKFAENIKRVVKEAGCRRHCLMLSEEIPPDWRETVPFVLETLKLLSL